MQFLNIVCLLCFVLAKLEFGSGWKPISEAIAYHTEQSSAEVDVKSLNTKPRAITYYPLTQENESNEGERKSLTAAEQWNFGDESSAYSKDHCAIKKFAFNSDGIVTYQNRLSDLNQFTICFWLRFTNHSGDHVALTYSAKNEPREIQFWIANSMNSSFFSMAIKGQQVCRLNTPLRIRKWHHLCSSWNGKTGEWQIWLNGERIGRGFHNSIVGYEIKGNGNLYSGGPSTTGDISQGLHFEITLIQVYKIALSAGKAHRDHKHHHVHHFNHEGQELPSTTRVPPMVNRPLLMHMLLANGQIPTNVRINLAQPQTLTSPAVAHDDILLLSPEKQTVSVNTNFVNGQINVGSRLISQQLISHAANPNNVQFVDETVTRVFFKRQAGINDTSSNNKQSQRSVETPKKRDVSFLDDDSEISTALFDDSYKYEGLSEFGGQQFKHDLTLKSNIEDEIAAHDREPAEEEVKSVMSLCGACDVEPFQGAVVMSWKDIKENLDNALKGFGEGKCGNF